MTGPLSTFPCRPLSPLTSMLFEVVYLNRLLNQVYLGKGEGRRRKRLEFLSTTFRSVPLSLRAQRTHYGSPMSINDRPRQEGRLTGQSRQLATKSLNVQSRVKTDNCPKETFLHTHRPFPTKVRVFFKPFTVQFRLTQKKLHNYYDI